MRKRLTDNGLVDRKNDQNDQGASFCLKNRFLKKKIHQNHEITSLVKGFNLSNDLSLNFYFI